MKVYRQGDVILVEVKAIPKGAKDVTPKGALVLAYGEVTGHAHKFKEDAEGLRMYQADSGERYIHVAGITLDLVHEEHSTVRVPKGKYLVPNQVEYTPAELRRVAD